MTVQTLVREAEALLRAGRLAEAQQLYQRILAREPAHVEALEKLAFIARAAGRHADAADLFRRLSRRLPDEPRVLVNLGNVLIEAGDQEAGLEVLGEAAAKAPDLAIARFSLGSALLHAGRRAEAGEHLEYAARHDGGQAEAFRLLTFARDIAPDDALAVIMRTLLARPGLGPRDRLHLHFALGAVHDRADDFDTAFSHIAMANRILKRDCRVKIEHYRAYFEDLKATFTPELIERLAGRSGRTRLTPIFIVGLPRCGSTLVETMLSRHPEVGTAGEVNYLAEEVTRPLVARPGAQFPQCLQDTRPRDLARLGEAYLKRLSGHAPGKGCVTDKNLAQFQVIGLIRVAFPNARILHVKRDPRDVGWSIFRNFFPENLPFYCDLEDFGRYHRLYRDLMAFWQDLCPDLICEVSYEALVGDPEAEMRRILAFLGLDWDPACLEPEAATRPIRTLSAVAARQPVTTGAVGGWKRYERHLAPLLGALGAEA